MSEPRRFKTTLGDVFGREVEVVEASAYDRLAARVRELEPAEALLAEAVAHLESAKRAAVIARMTFAPGSYDRDILSEKIERLTAFLARVKGEDDA